MGLKVITLTNWIDERLNLLENSCKRFGLDLKIIGEGSRWLRNACKLRILSDHLKEASYNPEDVLLIADAFDVVINGNENSIIRRYEAFDSDIVFAGEANYYFREPDLSLYYWYYYPRIDSSIYHFLNSGTLIGRVGALAALLNKISDHFSIDYTNDEQLTRVRSDQYLYSRFYADYVSGAVQVDFSVKLDAQQELFGCTGGRMTVVNWKDIHELQGYLLFKYERRMLKTFGLKSAQVKSKDLEFGSKTTDFINTTFKTSPLIIHLPGTYKNFQKILARIKGQMVFDKWFFFLPITLLISLIAFIRSVVNYWIIRSMNKGMTDPEHIFPVIQRRDKSILAKPSENKEPEWFYANDPTTPCKISMLRGKKVSIIQLGKGNASALEKLGISVEEVIDSKEFGPDDLNSNVGKTFLVSFDSFAPEIQNGIESTNRFIVFDRPLSEMLFKGKLSGGYPKDNPWTIVK